MVLHRLRLTLNAEKWERGSLVLLQILCHFVSRVSCLEEQKCRPDMGADHRQPVGWRSLMISILWRDSVMLRRRTETDFLPVAFWVEIDSRARETIKQRRPSSSFLVRTGRRVSSNPLPHGPRRRLVFSPNGLSIMLSHFCDRSCSFCYPQSGHKYNTSWAKFITAMSFYFSNSS